MPTMISGEYLASPGTCEDDCLSLVEDLQGILSDISLGVIPIYSERDVLERMTDMGLFPCARLFSDNMLRLGVSEYSGNDVARIVNRIIGALDRGWDGISCDLEVECDPIVSSKLDAPSRVAQVVADGLSRVFDSNNGCLDDSCRIDIFHYPVPVDMEDFDIRCRCRYLGADGDLVEREIVVGAAVQADYSAFLSRCDGASFFKSATDGVAAKFAFYVGALNFMLRNSKDYRIIQRSEFELGHGFFDSLRRHECSGDSGFASVLFDAVTRVISGCEKNDIKPFRESATSSKQIERGDMKAWRTHVTKAGKGLRLMFWTEQQSGKMIFANVGNKSELEII